MLPFAVARWVEQTYKQSTSWYVSVYGGYVACFLSALLIRGLFFFAIVRRASSAMHNKMFAAVLRAPLHFFTATPIGRVLGCFSKDQDGVDESLQDTIHMCTIYLMILGTTSGVVLSVVPYFAAILGALIIPSVLIFRGYIGASGALKRMVGAADATLNAHVSESQQGIAVIRAYGAEERFMRDNAQRLLASQRCTSNLETLQVRLRLE